MAVAAQFLDGLRERQIVAHGILDDLHQFGERKFKRDGGVFGVVSSGTASGGVTVELEIGDARPFAERGIIAEFGGVGIAGALDVRKPVARFGMNVNFVKRMAFNFAGIDAQHEMAVGGFAVDF